jgi:hypothetical protein
VFQTIRTIITKTAKEHPRGAWQFYLLFGLREDLAHHTIETTGYYNNRPESAIEADDLTAWTMALIQFLWGYDDLMGAVWDEWTMLRLIEAAISTAPIETNTTTFQNLTRQWEVSRPYGAPLNGTYADIRRNAFEEFLKPKLQTLPTNIQTQIQDQYQKLAAQERSKYQKQMSLLATMQSGTFLDTSQPISLWNAKVAIIFGGQYYFINVARHTDTNIPLVFTAGGNTWPLLLKNDRPVTPEGNELYLRGDQLFIKTTNEWIGYLDIAPAAQVKHQILQILQDQQKNDTHSVSNSHTDVLLAENPRKYQRKLRAQLSIASQQALALLSQTPIIINWDRQARENSLADLRRVQRGIGDHPLTIICTDSSMIFDQSHIFFDGTWSMAMAEVLTNAAINWCHRCITIAPSSTLTPTTASFPSTSAFLASAKVHQQAPEISAETTIWDISHIFKLRTMLSATGTRLTVNDLLIITRIFHAAHYKPSPKLQRQLDDYIVNATSLADRTAAKAIEHSLQRGRLTNPALLIPVDASPRNPRERIYPITFRNLAETLVWVWDDTWEAYQAYRRIEPPDTPEGIAALKSFALKRTFLIGNMRAFSYVLAANKTVAMRGDSLNIAILNLIAHLPSWLQYLLNAIPESLPVLNEIIKGDEVYSNVGRVSKGASITRFMSAKDDGATKALVWGVMTDDQNRLIVTMRDFRPHVKPLVKAGQINLAKTLAQDYVDTYTTDMIGLMARLSAMLQTETPQ